MLTPSSSTILEARARLKGLKFALNQNWENIILESNCKKMVGDILEEVTGLSNQGTIYEDIRELSLFFVGGVGGRGGEGNGALPLQLKIAPSRVWHSLRLGDELAELCLNTQRA